MGTLSFINYNLLGFVFGFSALHVVAATATDQSSKAKVVDRPLFASSPFLASSYQELCDYHRPRDLTSFKKYLETSSEIENLVVQGEGDEYTLVVPLNNGFLGNKNFRRDSPDPIMLSPNLRTQVLSDHIIKGRVDLDVLEEGITRLETLSGKFVNLKITTRKKPKFSYREVRLGKSNVQMAPTGGRMIIADEMITADEKLFDEAYKEYFMKNMSVRSPFDFADSQLLPDSSFLVEAYRFLKDKPDFRMLSRYLELTQELDHVIEGSDYTLVMPTNLGFTRWFSAGAVDPFEVDDQLRKKMLADHIIVGKLSRMALVDGGELETVSGMTLTMRIPDIDTIRLGDTAQVVYVNGLDNEDSPFLVTNSIVIVDTKSIEDVIAKHPKLSNETAKAPAVRGRSSDRLFHGVTMLQSVYRALENQTDFGTFRHYMEMSPSLSLKFGYGLKAMVNRYTMIVPDNFGIHRWTQWDPVDPFTVNGTLRGDMLANHVINKLLTIEDLVDGKEFGTRKGEILKVSINNGVISIGGATVMSVKGLIDTDTPILYTDSIVGIDRDGVQETLRRFHEAKPKTGPYSFEPNASESSTPSKLNLSVFELLYKTLENRSDLTVFCSYLAKSPNYGGVNLGNGLKSHYYTFVIPQNYGFRLWFPQETADPFDVDTILRNQMLADHLINGRLTKDDFVDGKVLRTVSGKNVTVSVKGSDISLGNFATVVSTDGLSTSSVSYIITNNLVLADENGIHEVLRTFHLSNPSKRTVDVEKETSIDLIPDAVVPAKPSFRSPFLEKAYELLLEGKDDYSTFRRYLADTPEFGDDFGWGAMAYSYTLVLPNNFGISRWLPQDTADPFSVDASLRKRMLADQVLRGRIKVEDLVDGKELKTLSKKTVIVSVKDGVVTLGDKAAVISTSGLGQRSSAYITTDSLMFVDQEGIQKALQTYSITNPRKERFGPELTTTTAVNVKADEIAGTPVPHTKPSFGSAFLRDAYRKLEGKKEYSAFRRYLADTPELEDVGFGFAWGAKAYSYTMVIPENVGISRWLPKDTADAFSVDSNLRKQMLADQIFIGRISVKDLVDGNELMTHSGKTVKVSVKDDVITLGDRATVVSTSGLDNKWSSRYMTTDSLIFVDQEGIQKAIRTHNEAT